MAFQISIGHLQRDGRRYVTETHFDAIGEYANIRYLLPVGADPDVIATQRGPDLIRQFSEVEAVEKVDSNARPSPRFQTIDEFLAKVRERYGSSKGIETCQIARWIVNRLNDGSVTVVQMRTAFSVSPSQWNSINGRMDTFANALTSVENAVGE